MKAKYVLAAIAPICIGAAVGMDIQSGLFSASNLSLTLRSASAVINKSNLGAYTNSTFTIVAQVASIILAGITIYARVLFRNLGKIKSKFH
ncbi:MAG: hypothetical protein QG670_17 [Thermoproteota archaeon]|nr:hypothetical protein [Thermoproteota archaeon]